MERRVDLGNSARIQDGALEQTALPVPLGRVFLSVSGISNNRIPTHSGYQG